MKLFQTLGLSAALAAGATAIAVAVPTVPGTAAPKPSPTPSPTVPPPPAATGCYNINGGGVTYKKFVKSYTETVPGSGVFTKSGIVLSDRGAVFTSVTLESASCLDVTYALEVFDASTDALLGRDTAVGNGTSDSVDLDVLFLKPGLTVKAQVTTIDRYGRVIDRGAAAPLTLTATSDGADPGTGGGQAFWG